MRVSTQSRRIVHVGAALLGVMISGSALAAAPVLTSFAGPATGKEKSVGETASYKATFTNTGTTHDHGTLTVDVTLPSLPGFTGTAGEVTLSSVAAEVAGVPADCTPVTDTQTSAVPCEVAMPDPGGLGETETVVVTFKVKLPVPDPLTTYTCPVVTNSVGDVTLVSSFLDSADVTTAYADTAAALYVAPFADLKAELTGPATGSENGSTTFVAKVTNLGPCVAENVVFAPSFDSKLAFSNVTGDCTGSYDEAFPTNDVTGNDECALGNLLVGESKTFTSTNTIGTFPKDLASTMLEASVTVYGDTVDPNAKNDTAATATTVDTGNSAGCS